MVTLTKTYHVAIGLPQGIQWPIVDTLLHYTTHACREAERDHIDDRLPLHLPDYMPVEVEMFGNIPMKWVVRCPLFGTKDLVLVLRNGPTFYLVATVWVNTRDDNHDTLDRTKYTVP